MSHDLVLLQQRIEFLFGRDLSPEEHAEGLQLVDDLRTMLSLGAIRAAEKIHGQWQVHSWVKKGILLGFRLGTVRDVSDGSPGRFFDKSTFPLKQLSLKDEVRIVPGGSAIRDGAFVGRGVICMPPMYVNVGAYVDEGTLIDSHALVGSCAQVGKRVHISAGAQVGGVLEPVGALPVIIEDGVLLGGNCGVYEGTIVGADAVLAAGVILTGGTAVYDAIHQRTYRKESGRPLVIPERAVVVPGSRPFENPWALEHQLHIATPVIVKYRDEKTDRSALLEEALR